MTLPKTKAKSVEERRDELVSSVDDEFLRIVSYRSYENLPEVKPHLRKPENIRFYPGGVEVLVGFENSNRIINNPKTLENSPIDTTFVFLLIDESRKRVYEYSIDAQRNDY